MLERNTTYIIQSQIERLYRLQKTSNFNENSGLWPSYRKDALTRPVLDNNIFVSATVVYILEQCKAFVDEKNRSLISEMQKKAQDEFPNYRNKDGRLSYNFWRTKPSDHFPNGKFLRHFDYLRLPDDTDDTALIGLASKLNKNEVQDMIDIISSFANGKRREISRAPKELKKFKAITTFMGVNTPLEFDISMQCNALSLFYKYEIPLNESATETIAYIRKLILDRTILSDPFFASPNYFNPLITFYHIARLIFSYDKSELSKLKNEMLEQTNEIECRSYMDSFFLSYTKLLLGEKSKYTSFDAKALQPFFIAGMLSGFENPLAQWLAPMRFCHVHFYSEALNIALQLHYNLLWENLSY